MRLKIYCFAARLCAALFFTILTCSLFAQKTVSGTVTSAKDNKPFVGATVIVKGTKVATSTSANGTFTIKVPAGSTVLVISSIGFEDEEVNVSSQTL